MAELFASIIARSSGTQGERMFVKSQAPAMLRTAVVEGLWWRRLG